MSTKVSYKYFISSLIFVFVLGSILIPFSIGKIPTPNFRSGMDHGCKDASISNSSNRYINQPHRGASFHSPEFMQGYYKGFHQCSKISFNSLNNTAHPIEAKTK